MRLAKPTLEMREAYLDFVREWEDHREEIRPHAARLLGRSYEQWLEDIRLREVTAPEGSVRSYTYLWMDSNGSVIGAVNLRPEMDDRLMRAGGQIGYGIRPSCRRFGHARAMLTATLFKARDLGLKRVMLVCEKDNVAAARTILRNGGVLENEVGDDGRILQRYWIEL